MKTDDPLDDLGLPPLHYPKEEWDNVMRVADFLDDYRQRVKEGKRIRRNLIAKLRAEPMAWQEAATEKLMNKVVKELEEPLDAPLI